MMSSIGLFLILYLVTNVYSSDNGLARTPPMGWLSWVRFECETDCESFPNDCINAKLYEEMANHLEKDGWKDVGYNQINIDDCWNLPERDPVTGVQVADPDRFPNGIKGVANHVHKLGLKLGLYNDIGTISCAHYAAIDGHYELDANTFASWDIDMIKIDGCNGNISDYYQMYPKFGAALNATGRPIIYSCSWPAYIPGHGENEPPVDNTTLKDIAKYCNLWRNYHDVADSWDSIESIIQYWSRDYTSYSTDQFLNVAGPGNWNDADQIVAGNYGLSFNEAEAQFALWAIFASPLLMSNDLRSINNEYKQLLQNKEIIDVNQDPMGKQGGLIYKGTDSSIFMRELSTNNSIAIVMLNTASLGFGSYMTFNVSMIPSFVKGWGKNTIFEARNLFNHSDLGTFDMHITDFIHTSSVGMYKLTPIY